MTTTNEKPRCYYHETTCHSRTSCHSRGGGNLLIEIKVNYKLVSKWIPNQVGNDSVLGMTEK